MLIELAVVTASVVDNVSDHAFDRASEFMGMTYAVADQQSDQSGPKYGDTIGHPGIVTWSSCLVKENSRTHITMMVAGVGAS